MKHIAVVEDEALMREELADMLRRADYAVTEITDFSDVTGQLLALAPDLAIVPTRYFPTASLPPSRVRRVASMLMILESMICTILQAQASNAYGSAK